MTAYPDDNPKTVQGEKKIDLSLVPPSAIIAEARVMGLGARKYGPYNWREKTVSSRVYIAAAMRHLLTYLDGEDLDSESGESHLAHARACCGIVIDAASLGKLNDNRPPKGAAGRLLIPAEKGEYGHWTTVGPSQGLTEAELREAVDPNPLLPCAFCGSGPRVKHTSNCPHNAQKATSEILTASKGSDLSPS